MYLQEAVRHSPTFVWRSFTRPAVLRMRGISEVAVIQHTDDGFGDETAPHQQYKEMAINGSETDLTRESSTAIKSLNKGLLDWR